MLSGMARLLETCSEKVSADLHDWDGIFCSSLWYEGTFFSLLLM